MSKDDSLADLQKILMGPFSLSDFEAFSAYIAEGTRLLANLRKARRASFPEELIPSSVDDEAFESESEAREKAYQEMLLMGREIQVASLMGEILMSLQHRTYVITGTGVEHCGQDEHIAGQLTKQFATAGTRKEAEAIALQLGEKYGSVVFEVLPTNGVLPSFSF